MKKIIFGFKKFVNCDRNLMTTAIVLMLSITLMMPPGVWHGNEEIYLGSAWRRFSPEAIQQVSALVDPVHHRLVFDYLTGLTIQTIGFDWTHTLGRILVICLFSISLAIFFQSLALSGVAAGAIVLAFYGLGEDILAGEWLFRGFEAKTLAYPFVIFAFVAFIRQRYKLAYSLLTIATYFHFLVGAFWCLAVGICQFWRTQNLRKTLLDSARYGLLCLPLVILIALNQQRQIQANSVPAIDWIYSYFRAPHHVAPLASAGTFWNWYHNGIVFLIGLTVISVILVRTAQTKTEKVGSQFILSFHLYLLVALLIACLDRQGITGKFYLLRPSSLILLLTLCWYTLLLKNWLGDRFSKFTWAVFVLVISLVLPVLPGHQIIYSSIESAFSEQISPPLPLQVVGKFLIDRQPKSTPEFAKIVAASEKTDIFLLDPKLEGNYLFFERVFDRPTLVLHKNIPTQPARILRWYNLILQREIMFNQGCPAQIVSDYRIRYLLAHPSSVAAQTCGKVVYNGEGIQLIEIDTRFRGSQGSDRFSRSDPWTNSGLKD
jgi:hypothetical protein